MSLQDLGKHIAANNCRWCIGGMSPAGIHPELGPVLSLCPTQVWCEKCSGYSVYPAEYETLDDRINEMLHDGLAAIWCESCNGVLAVIPVSNDGGIR